MSDMGFQTFINGTSFDATNSMAFNYIIDIFVITAGSGSRDYSAYPDSDFSVVCINDSLEKDKTFTYSQSGTTLNWTSSFGMRMAVIATPVSGSKAKESMGFAYYADGKIKLTPSFTPMVLFQVLDVTAGLKVVQTNVPAGRKFLAFHRGTDTSGNSLDQVWWKETTQNGYIALNIDVVNSTGFRLYVFSDIPVNPPDYGFFVYKNGAIVYHSNCLPLIVKVWDRQENANGISSNSPMAVGPGVVSFISGGSAGTAQSSFICSSAGFSQSLNPPWRVTAVIYTTNIGGNPQPGWSVRYIPYIDTAVYDQYYLNALG